MKSGRGAVVKSYFWRVLGVAALGVVGATLIGAAVSASAQPDRTHGTHSRTGELEPNVTIRVDGLGELPLDELRLTSMLVYNRGPECDVPMPSDECSFFYQTDENSTVYVGLPDGSFELVLDVPGHRDSVVVGFTLAAGVVTPDEEAASFVELVDGVLVIDVSEFVGPFIALELNPPSEATSDDWSGSIAANRLVDEGWQMVPWDQGPRRVSSADVWRWDAPEDGTYQLVLEPRRSSPALSDSVAVRVSDGTIVNSCSYTEDVMGGVEAVCDQDPPRSESGRFVFDLPIANLLIRPTPPGFGSFPEMDPSMLAYSQQVFLVDAAGPCGETIGTEPCNGIYGVSGFDGAFKFSVEDGEYVVYFGGAGYPMTRAELAVAAGVVSVEGNPEGRARIVDGVVEVAAEVALEFTTDPFDASTAASIERWTGEWFETVQFPWGAVSDSAAQLWRWNPPQDGIYRFSFTPSADSGFATTKSVIRIVNDTITATCSETAVLQRESEPCTGPAPAVDQGVAQFPLDRANLTVAVCMPGEPDQCESPSSVSASLSRLNAGQWSDVGYYSLSFWPGQQPSPEARMSLRLADPGEYRLRFEPPFGTPDPLARIDVYLTVTTAEGGAVSIARCTGAADDRCGQNEALSQDDGVFDLGQVRYEFASSTGTVVDPEGQPVQYSYVSIMRPVDDGSGSVWFEHVQGSSTDAQGRFVLDLDSLGVGSFRIRAEAPWDSEFTRGQLDVVVTAAGGVLSISPEPRISLTRPNVAGTVMAGSRTVRHSGVSLERSVSQGGYEYWQHVDWASTDSEGRYQLRVDDGAYRIVAQPGWNTSSEFSTGTVTLVVSGGQVTEVNGDAVTPAPTAEVDIALREANVSIQLTGEGRANAWVSFDPIDVNDPYQWMPGSGNNANAAGLVTAALDAGVYAVTVYPGGTGQLETTAFISVTEGGGGGVCRLDIDSRGDLVATPTPSCDPVDEVLALVLLQPNFVARVFDSEDDPVRGWMSVERWEGSYWQHAERGGSTDGAGFVRLFLESGRHRFWITPESSTTAAAATVYVDVVVADGATTACAFEESALLTDPPCDAEHVSDGAPLVIVLPGPNVAGRVVDGDGDALPWGWVEVRKARVESFGDDEFVMWDWFSSASVSGNGSFALSVPQEGAYRLVINPPWGSSGLSRRTMGFWVNGSGHVCGALPSGVECAPFNDGSSDFVLGGGTVTGTVVTPDGSAMARSYVHVERWNNSWGYWEWVDLSGQTDSQGRFDLGVDEAGTYRLRADAPWNRRAEYSPGVLTFEYDGTPLLNQQVVLTAPNVTGTVETSDGAGVREAWVELQRKRTETWGGESYVWWEWVGSGTSTDSAGAFALFVTPPAEGAADEVYRLRVQPPWNGAGLTTFTSVEFTVASEFTGETFDDPALVFPEPNLQLLLTRSEADSSPVGDAWIYVEELVTVGEGEGAYEYWNWTDISTATRSDGRAALNITGAGSYRLVVGPLWSEPGSDLPRFTEEFTVTDGVVAFSDGREPNSGVFTLSYPVPNVIGSSVFVDGDTRTSNRWGWLEVREVRGDEVSWLSGIGLSEGGRFAMALAADATYELTVWPNWERSDVLPVTAIVTVAGDGTVTKWRYDSDDAATDRCVEGEPCRINLEFTKAPNLVLSVTFDGSPAPGAYVRLTGLTGDARSFTFVTGAGGSVEVQVPAGTYQARAAVLGDDGVISSESVEVTVSAEGEMASAVLVLTSPVGAEP